MRCDRKSLFFQWALPRRAARIELRVTVPACFNRYFDLANSEVAERTLPAEDDAADSEVVEPAEPATVTPEDDTGIRGGPFSDNIHK